jgi:N utilization substance protein B
MSARSKARKRALDVLFEADQRGSDPLQTLADWIGRADPPVPDYAAELVRGVVAHQEAVDGAIRELAGDWPLERMPAVDRAILRIGTYEVLFEQVPRAVAIDEAVELAKQLSTDESPRFVNGVLARVGPV